MRIVDELCDFYLPQTQQAGVMLRTQLPREELMVKVDEGLLKQAILNLMLNATQAMTELRDRSKPGASQHAGELILRVEADSNQARIHVIDTGPGIAASKLDDIFRPYVSLRSGGTGLGLPTARRIVQEHGGELTVHSEVGRGSDFTVHLPRVEEQGRERAGR